MLTELTIDRDAVIAWYQRNRARSRALFDLIEPAAYYSRPIALRNPIVFYEGHLPAFSVIAFLKRGLGLPGIDPELEELFARGIDPETEANAVPRSGAATAWPSRDEVLAYAAQADRAVIDALRNGFFVEDRPAMRRAEALFTALEHEAMHQETLLYMWHRLPHVQKRKPRDVRYVVDAKAPAPAVVMVPEGIARLGTNRDGQPFGWDNEFDAHTVRVPSFEIDVYDVTNADFLEFVEAGGYRARELWTPEDWEWVQQHGITHPHFWSARDGAFRWRGMFEDIPLPPAWPVYASQAEASAYARWKRRRLPTEAEFHRAAYGDCVSMQYPWGDAAPDATRANVDFMNWEPVPAGSRPAGASPFGVHDLLGNGWEWTSTIFGPFAGFAPMPSYPEYSADFFDGQHYVLKGGSPATARELLRPSFRNWFRPHYPYVYATFRTVR